MRQVRSARMTTGNSSPFALCTVISRTPSLLSSRIGASALSLAAAVRSSSMKPRNEMPPLASYCRASSATCSTLASACSPAGRRMKPTCARVVGEQPANRVGDRPIVARRDAAAAAAAARRQSASAARSARRSARAPDPSCRRAPSESGTDGTRRSDAGTRADARRRSRTASPSASRTPTARRPATRSPRAPRGSSRLLRGRETPCRRPAGAECRAPRSRRRRRA